MSAQVEPKFATCSKCGHDRDHFADCWSCAGEGGFHDCGEDTCCCLDKDEVTHDCEICEGEGGYYVCPICVGDDQ